ncbi:hypothetical protein F3Y22_tig00110584pilonHSYRG00230 [Hibiscus syriacus]|uniref:Uncharacterized protein n=1 Tax=Hibiscus syriacus TaxID=106335 RepID=A0A6A3A7V4_HIBSY|nr:hypothetical protein F3Y22_tig00110584pilonHSYRG00230 [Hibiscus syriacus]
MHLQPCRLLPRLLFLYVGMDALDIEKWRFVSDSPGTSVAVSAVLLASNKVRSASTQSTTSMLSDQSTPNRWRNHFSEIVRTFDDSFVGIIDWAAFALFSQLRHTVHYYWRKFDNAFMRPMFGRGLCPLSRLPNGKE